MQDEVDSQAQGHGPAVLAGDQAEQQAGCNQQQQTTYKGRAPVLIQLELIRQAILYAGRLSDLQAS